MLSEKIKIFSKIGKTCEISTVRASVASLDKTVELSSCLDAWPTGAGLARGQTSGRHGTSIWADAVPGRTLTDAIFNPRSWRRVAGDIYIWRKEATEVRPVHADVEWWMNGKRAQLSLPSGQRSTRWPTQATCKVS